MTSDGDAPLTRRAAREARRAAGSSEGQPPSERRTGLQPPLDDDAPSGTTSLASVAQQRERPVPTGHDLSGATGPRSTAPPATVAGHRDDAVGDAAGDAAAGPDAVSLTKGSTVPDAGAGAGAVEPDEAPAVRRRRRTGGLAQAGAEDFSLAQAIGGVRGAAETLVPGLLFVVTYTISRDLTVSLAVSVGAALLAIVLRVVTRSAPAQALSGAVGVGVCAVFALLSGEARNFYLPGFLLNIGYGLLCLLSTIPFRRFRIPRTAVEVGPGPYPVIGLLLGPLTGEGLAWRQVPARLRVYQRVTWLWAGFFLLRLAVQVPLFLADMVGALGAARLAMGVPAFALMVWVTWLMLRSVPRAVPGDDPVPAGADAEGGDPLTKDQSG